MKALQLRKVARVLRRTPLHPQWLLGSQARTTSVIKENARGRVLDIGCATRWVESVLPAECQYVGVDYLATGRDMYGARPDVFGDASALPVADATCDTVIFLEVLEHLRSPHVALLEIARVLAPGGALVLSMPFLYPIHDAPQDYQRFTEHGLRREITDAGLQMEAISPSLGSAESAGLLACLAIGGMVENALSQKMLLGLVTLPVALMLITTINLACKVLGMVLPSWAPATAGYLLVARRPA